MSAPNPRLLAAAVDDARTQLAAAETVDLNDELAVIASQAALAASLRWVLWTLNAEDDDVPDVAGQVAAEDGVRTIGVPYTRPAVAA